MYTMSTCGVGFFFSIATNHVEKYLLEQEEWKNDVIPEIMDGHNVADFFDPDIAEKLDALEREEARLEEAGFYESVSEEEDEEMTDAIKNVRDKKKLAKMDSMLKKSKNAVIIPRNKRPENRRGRQDSEEWSDVEMEDRGRSQSARTRSESRAKSKVKESKESIVQPSRSKSVIRDRSTIGLKDVTQRKVADKLKAKGERKRNQFGKAGEADRHIGTKMPKHLFAGKRGMGKTQRR